jgi:hypothetical protein
LRRPGQRLGPGHAGDVGRVRARLGEGYRGQLRAGEAPDVIAGRVVEHRDGLDQVGEQFGPHDPLTLRPLQLIGALRRVRRSPALHVVHARVDHARGDATPDPVGDAELALHDKVPQVMWQLGPRPRELLHPVDHAVVSFDDRVGARMIGEPPERDAHEPTMRIYSAGGLSIFRRTPGPSRARPCGSFTVEMNEITTRRRRWRGG